MPSRSLDLFKPTRSRRFASKYRVGTKSHQPLERIDPRKDQLSEGGYGHAIHRRPQAIYRTAWEIPMRSLIDMAADRGAFIDQSQSLNLFMESPNIGKLSSMYMYAWQKGLKTTYYLRSRPATRIAQVSAEYKVSDLVPEQPKKVYSDEEALVCSLENPEACEACQ